LPPSATATGAKRKVFLAQGRRKRQFPEGVYRHFVSQNHNLIEMTRARDYVCTLNNYTEDDENHIFSLALE